MPLRARNMARRTRGEKRRAGPAANPGIPARPQVQMIKAPIILRPESIRARLIKMNLAPWLSECRASLTDEIEFIDIEQPAIGHFKMRDHRQGKERDLKERFG